MTIPGLHSSRSRGITLIDLICLLVMLGVATSLVSAGIDVLRDRVVTTRLETDIRDLNQSIYLYRASGGSFEDVATPLDVIARIQAAESSKLTYVGNNVVTGCSPDLQSTQEARSNAKRAVWNPESQQFEISRGGKVGIKAFDPHQAH